MNNKSLTSSEYSIKWTENRTKMNSVFFPFVTLIHLWRKGLFNYVRSQSHFDKMWLGLGSPLIFGILSFMTEIWSPSRPDGERHTHGLCGGRSVDGLLRGLLHSPVSHGNTGASAGNQHLHTVHPAEHWYVPHRDSHFICKLWYWTTGCSRHALFLFLLH